MTWIAWRVQRDQYLVAAVAAGAVAAWLVAGGLVPAAGWAVGSAHGLAVVLFLLPGVLGAALGAPLVGSEVEHGTHRLAFTQTTGRARWLVRKLVVTGAVVALLTAVLSVLARWWLQMSHAAGALLMSPKDFGITGTVVVAGALFGFGLGVLFGALLRNAGWAFALAAPVAIIGRLAVGAGRTTFSPPVGVVDPSLNMGWEAPGQRIHAAYLPLGHLTPPAGRSWTMAARAARSAMHECIAHVPGSGLGRERGFAGCAKAAHLHFVIQYQPVTHYWALQGVDSAFLVAGGLVALLASVRLLTLPRVEW